MTTTSSAHPPDDVAIMNFFRTIGSRDTHEVDRILNQNPALGVVAIRDGASRQVSSHYYLDDIPHYVYAGDTGLHIAAAAHLPEAVRSLIARGASVRAQNRRGAEPLHYAADGSPDGPAWDPIRQHDVIQCLIQARADPNTRDGSGVAPLHRAVRTRCAAAVRALVTGGADPRLANKKGSTPLHLAVQSTGRGGSGTDAAKEQQRDIILVLLAHGARPTDTDANGKTVEATAVSDWVRELLRSR